MTGKERREQLLDIGRRLFAERGFEGTSIEEIAAKAGVSKPVVYEHFGGKEGLYAVVVDREVDRLLTLAEELGPAEKAPRGARRGDATGRRQSVMPLIEIARTRTKDEAMAALATWRDRYPAAADRLKPADVLVDGMRGPSSIWYRIRINLQHVPGDQRPPQEELIADYSPWPTR